jgi:hypothetical protein
LFSGFLAAHGDLVAPIVVVGDLGSRDSTFESADYRLVVDRRLVTQPSDDDVRMVVPMLAMVHEMEHVAQLDLRLRLAAGEGMGEADLAREFGVQQAAVLAKAVRNPIRRGSALYDLAVALRAEFVGSGAGSAAEVRRRVEEAFAAAEAEFANYLDTAQPQAGEPGPDRAEAKQRLMQRIAEHSAALRAYREELPSERGALLAEELWTAPGIFAVAPQPGPANGEQTVVESALRTLAEAGLPGLGHQYLEEKDPQARKRILLEPFAQLNPTRARELGELPALTRALADLTTTDKRIGSEQADVAMLRAIAAAGRPDFDDALADVIDLRKFVAGGARVDWVVRLANMATHWPEPDAALQGLQAGSSLVRAAIQQLQEAIVTCDREDEIWTSMSV